MSRMEASSRTCGSQYSRPTSMAAMAAICDATGGHTRIVSWHFAIAEVRCSGYTMYPTRHPAKPYAFDSEYIEMVQSVAPGNAADETCRAAPYVKYSYTSSAR